MSTSSSGGPESDKPTVEDTLDKLFESSQQQLADVASTSTDAWFASAGAADPVAAAASWEPVWYNVSDQAVLVVQTFHNLTGLEYGWSIVGVTILLRTCLFPVMVMTQRTQSRMAHLQPELLHIQKRYEALGTPSRQDQLQFSKNMQALFAKYQVKPLRGFAAPLLQIPLFMGMFFGLQKMPGLFPQELSTGGMFWFPDLTLTDPLYILPVASTASFLILIEIGKEQMMATNPSQGQLMLNLFRALSLVMLPVCINFESSMLVYWCTNNVLTITQTLLLKSPSIKASFGIWDPPKPVPGAPQPDSIVEAVTKISNKLSGQGSKSEQQKMKERNQAIDARKKAEKMLLDDERGKQQSGRT